jgi:F0F1-type ATP synthase assembly protein I
MNDKNGFHTILTTLFLFGHNLFWHENSDLFKYFFALYLSAIVSFVLSDYSLLRFSLALITGEPLGVVVGYSIGYLVNHYYPIQDGPGMAPNFTDIFRLFVGIITGLTIGLITAALILNRLRNIRQNTKQVAQSDEYTPRSG